MKKIAYVVAGLMIIALLAACGSQAPATPTTDPNQILTAVNQAVQTQLAQTQAALPTATPTPEPTATETPTPTQLTTSTTLNLPTLSTTGVAIVIPSTDATAGPDDAQFDSDVTIPDNTVIKADHQFTKTWRVKNTGTTTWNSSYKLVYLDGISISDVPTVLITPEVTIPTTVAPGATVDISVSLVTPNNNGTYKYWFRLLNPEGHFFGESLYVLFVVNGS